jgi:hypothetical protein
MSGDLPFLSAMPHDPTRLPATLATFARTSSQTFSTSGSSRNLIGSPSTYSGWMITRFSVPTRFPTSVHMLDAPREGP